MPFPATFDELKAAGYRFINHASCRRCGADIEWWITSAGNKMPMDLMEAGTSKAIPHFSTCSD